ncbi:MAG: hypothetical protein DMD89_04260 [Candidatus Rokuibacteriota bacterium]|nr:MAG: hypothetical protein DMD89_04260 [Candidatus Rokubacteria bacterium]
MLARLLEASGIATTSISMVREHTEKVKPPRALFVPFPFGHALGRANDPELQHRVLRAALDLLAEPAGPVLRDFPDGADPGDQPPAPRQASAIAAGGVADDPTLEVEQMCERHREWLSGHGGRTAFGLSGIPASRFAPVVSFLRRFGAGEDADLDARPTDVPRPNFIRYCADDLKALYFEAYMIKTPAAGGDEITRWFWAETAVGQLLRRVRDRLDASDDPAAKAAAFGVAR